MRGWRTHLLLSTEMAVSGMIFAACHQRGQTDSWGASTSGCTGVFIACCIPYKFCMESKSFWTRFLLQANTLIRNGLFGCFPEGELPSKGITMGLHITVLLISKLSFGWRLPSLWGKGFWVSAGGCTIFSQQKSEPKLESVVIMHGRKSRASLCGLSEITGRVSCTPTMSDCSLMANSCMSITARSEKSDKTETFARCPFTVTIWPL